MKLSYSITGAERKSLVGAISQALNAPTNYLGAPTFAYEVGGYRIDKFGTVTGADNLDLEDALHQAGFDASEREYDEPDTYESGLGGMGALESPEELGAMPAFEDLRLDEREELGLGRTRREDFQGENGMRADDVPEPDSLVIEVPLDGFTPEKLDNLAKLVKAKEGLLKAALGAENLPIRQTGDTLSFPWFSGELDGDTVKAYATLVERICAAAKEKSRVAAKEREVENPKYAMRCWLLSLGFIGGEYKVSRKILLKNLNGDSSYKSGAKKKTEVRDHVSE